MTIWRFFHLQKGRKPQSSPYSSHVLARLQKQEQENWRNAKNEDEIRKLKGKLRRLEATLPAMEQKDRRLESRNKYFEEVLKELKKLEQANVECPVCLTDIETEECRVTACGHLFCQNCITGWLKDKGHKCPTCNHPLQLPGGVAAATEVLSRNQEVSSQARIARFGSKLEATLMEIHAETPLCRPKMKVDVEDTMGWTWFSVSKEELEEEAESKQDEKPREPEPSESEQRKAVEKPEQKAVEEPEQKHKEHTKTPEVCPPTSKPEPEKKHVGEPRAHEQPKQVPETSTKAPEPRVDEKPQPAELEKKHDKPGEAHGGNPATPRKSPDIVVEIHDDSQQEIFQDSQTPPEWKEDAAYAQKMRDLDERTDPKPDSSATTADATPKTPCKNLLDELEKEEEREDLKSDEEDLAKRQAFKD
eukprot:s117_g14.t1